MYTEPDLRDALAHSAERADTMVADGLEELLTEISDELHPPSRVAHRRPGLLVALAAACVVAIATAAVALTNSVGSRRHEAERTVAPQPSSALSTPANGRSSTRDIPPPANLPAHTPAGIGQISDVAVAGAQGVSYEISQDGSLGRAEELDRSLDAHTRIVVEIVPSRADFDPDRIPRTHPMQVGDRKAFYSRWQVVPVSGNDNRGKFSPEWTLSVDVGNGTWAFAQLDSDAGKTSVSLNAPGRLVKEYNALQLDYVSNRLRVPVRMGYLPHGMAIHAFTLRTGAAPEVDVGFAKGGTGPYIDIVVVPLATSRPNLNCKLITCGSYVTRDTNGFHIFMSSYDYDKKTLTRIAATMVVTQDSAYWWTIRQAFG